MSSRNPRSTRAPIALALIAAVALMVGTLGASGAAAGATSVGDATASAKKKKKKCKKGKVKVKLTGKALAKAKKKGKPLFKCKKPRPLVRATLTWNTGNTDFDLWVFDASGNRARAGSNPIPNTAFSPNDLLGFGPETFTDLKYVKGKARPFSYGVCFEDGGSSPTTFTLTYVDAKGVSKTVSELLGSDGAFRTYPGGAPIPQAPFCKI